MTGERGRAIESKTTVGNSSLSHLLSWSREVSHLVVIACESQNVVNSGCDIAW